MTPTAGNGRDQLGISGRDELLAALSAIRADAAAALAAVSTPDQLKDIRDTYLSRKRGRLTLLLKSLGGLSPEDKRRAAELFPPNTAV